MTDEQLQELQKSPPEPCPRCGEGRAWAILRSGARIALCLACRDRGTKRLEETR